MHSPHIHSSTIYNSQVMEATPLFINRQMETVYTIKYYSTIKKNEILPFSAMWVGQQNIMLRTVSQTERKILTDIPYTWNLKNK